MNPDLTLPTVFWNCPRRSRSMDNVLTGIDLRTGRGDSIFVTVRADISPFHGRDDIGNRYKMAVAAALGAARHHLEVKWDH